MNRQFIYLVCGGNMFNWFSRLSIRWKLQIGFFLVTMLTTIFNRTLASHELGKLISIAVTKHVNPGVVAELQHSHHLFIVNSVWESGIEFALQFIIIAIVANFFVRPIQGLCVALSAIHAGDLTQKVENRSHDEIGVLERNFNEMREKLNDILGSIDDSGKEMGQSAYQIATIAKEISAVSKSEHMRSEEVNSATQDLVQISATVQQLASEAEQAASESETQAKIGIDSVQKNIDKMQHMSAEVLRVAEQLAELESSASKIHDIVATINNIAEQTNLLSLNAAIEAARAGEAGRGFAVVADEVRNLSMNTSDSLHEINGIIDMVSKNIIQVSGTMSSVVTEVEGYQTQAQATQDMISGMANHALESANSNKKITSASVTQQQKLEVLNTTLQNLFETLDESSSKVDTTASIGDNMYQLTEKMNKILSGFYFEHHKSELVRSPNEKRRYPRYGNNLLVKIDQGKRHIEGVTRDFSVSGLQVSVPEPLEQAHQLSLLLYLPSSDISEFQQQDPLELQGEIQWQREEDGRYYYGMEFVGVSDIAKQRLAECLKFFNEAPEYLDKMG